DDAQYGWYPSSASGEVQTTDRCIGAVAINASNQVIDFDHDGGRYFEFAAEYAAYSIAYPSTDWSTQVTFRAPTFCTRVHASFDAYADGAVPAAYTVSYREGSDSGNGHTVGRAYKLGSGDENQLNSFNSLPVTIDSSQQIDIKVSQA
ncbi:MAG: hypothetical protein GWN13_29740, partial [Phycisphaerae bacterium]|nr:hypothetical protein [Phycisphaerae bacterium]